VLTFAKQLTHRPLPDGTVGTHAHISFYEALEIASDAWAQLIDEVTASKLTTRDVAVVHVEADFAHELFVGDALIEVEVASVGTSSIAFELRILQSDRSAATIGITVAQIDPTRKRAVPLTAQQRDPLVQAASLTQRRTD
jgi:acyl-CoA thioesterase FadM